MFQNNSFHIVLTKYKINLIDIRIPKENGSIKNATFQDFPGFTKIKAMYGQIKGGTMTVAVVASACTAYEGGHCE